MIVTSEVCVTYNSIAEVSETKGLKAAKSKSCWP